MISTAVINIVGLSKKLIGANTPFLNKWLKNKSLSVIEPVLPAVTCSAQSTYLTGKYPKDHGIVANGWYFRDDCEVKLWRQSNKLVQAPKVWDIAKQKDPNFTCANMFWWYNMYSNADYSVTPRPQYLADGRKMPDCYSHPADLRDSLQSKLGTFPLFDFWGPRTSIKSSQWIADASMFVHTKYNPTLTLVYLPHLDYCLQKYAHNSEQVKKDLLEIDRLCEQLVEYFEKAGTEVMLLSEYGISEVNNPIHINRLLRENGLINIRTERGLELLDAGASDAFAMADHQIAHIYVNNPDKLGLVKSILEKTPGIALVLDNEGKQKHHLDHYRAGELVVVADNSSWFTYYYWLDDQKAPDFARTVDIHNKPGYDPVEMFFDPDKKLIMPRAMIKLLKKKMGFRVLMDLIPLDATLVKGSHGSINVPEGEMPIIMGNLDMKKSIKPTEVSDLILRNIFKT